MSIKISRPRIFRSTNDVPLTQEQIKGVAPAVFQEHAYGQMSANYAYIPTYHILAAMLEEGFTVHEVAQTRPRRGDRDPYAKHMLRLRFPNKKKRTATDVTPELVLVNAHDGTARYYLYGGLYRFICCNGLMVGSTFTSIVVAHRGGDITRSRILEGSYSMVQDEFPKILTAMEQMKQVTLDIQQRIVLATAALKLRYGEAVPTFPMESLLEVRRPEDEGNDLWSVYNRIQENVIEGGFGSRSTLFNRRTTVRPVERVNNRVNINRGLWDAAMGFINP